MTKQQIIDSFDPSQPGIADSRLFSLPFNAADSEIIIIPVPWEVTVSYGGGTSDGPEAIIDASAQVDLYHQEFPELWKLGIYLDKNGNTENWKIQSAGLKEKAQKIIEAFENGDDVDNDESLSKMRSEINNECRKLHDGVREQTLHWLQKDKLVALIGGDHSTPLGYYEALATKYKDFGILHLDAHMDLRIAYEGFEYSHASIMHNALKIKNISKIVQVGIRDFCAEEADAAKDERVIVHTDRDIKIDGFNGVNWHEKCLRIIKALPENVAISVDIDSLLAWYCPGTGTPVPGGLSFEEATYLLSKLANSGKKIIGFDLVEVSPRDDDWDGNVGARMLFHLCGVFAKGNGKEVGSVVGFNK